MKYAYTADKMSLFTPQLTLYSPTHAETTNADVRKAALKSGLCPYHPYNKIHQFGILGGVKETYPCHDCRIEAAAKLANSEARARQYSAPAHKQSSNAGRKC